MNNYIVGTRVRHLATGEVGTINAPLGAHVFQIDWDAPGVNEGPLKFRYFSQDWLDTMCVITAKEASTAEEPIRWYPKPGMKIRPKDRGDDAEIFTGTIESTEPIGRVVVFWEHLGQALNHSERWIKDDYEPIPDEEEKVVKKMVDPHTWVTIREPVKVKLEKCPFCGSYSQKLVDGLVMCESCSAHAYVEDWNHRS